MAEVLVATIMRAEGDTGVQTHFRTFLDWLAARGDRAGLVTPYAAPKWMVYPVFGLRSVVDRLSGTASVWWYRYWHALFLEYALRRRLADGKACVVYAQCPLAAGAALRARRNASQRVVLVVHFNISQADEWAGKGMIAMHGAYARRIRAFEANTLPRLDGLVFVSEFMRRELLARMPEIERVPFSVVPNFVPDPEISSDALSPRGDLLVVGTLEPRKNQAYALEIVAMLARQGHALSLTVAGDGPDKDALRAKADALGIADRVKFLGFVRNAADLFASHRACLHAARIENLPLTLVEAMSRGVPVFAPAVGGIPEVVTDGIEGRVIPLDDAPRAAAMIAEWFENGGGRLRQAGACARATFLERFVSDVAAERLRGFLMSVGVQ